MALAKDAEWSHVDVNNPFLSASDELPMVRSDHVVASGCQASLDALSASGIPSLDADLNASQQLDSAAYVSLLETTAYDAMLHAWFHDEDNYVGTTRPALARLCRPWYRSFSIQSHLKHHADTRLAQYQAKMDESVARWRWRNAEHGESWTEKEHATTLEIELMPEVYKHVWKVYEALAVKLGDQMFFFGDKPTSLDVYCYAYLAPHLLRGEFARTHLADTLTARYSTLVAHIARMRELVMPEVERHYDPALAVPTMGSWQIALPSWMPLSWRADAVETVMKPTVVHAQTETEAEDRETRRQRFVTIVSGVAAMLGYMIWNGMLYVSSEERSEDDPTHPPHYESTPVEL